MTAPFKPQIDVSQLYREHREAVRRAVSRMTMAAPDELEGVRLEFGALYGLKPELNATESELRRLRGEVVTNTGPARRQIQARMEAVRTKFSKLFLRTQP